MTRETALALFDEIEKTRFEYGDIMAPHFNVRLDAGTDGDTDERFYKLFVRLDRHAPAEERTEHLRWLTEEAERQGVTATLENAGMELA
jgi:hypothetical protein